MNADLNKESSETLNFVLFVTLIRRDREVRRREYADD